MMRAREIMTENPACCTPEDTARTAARLMSERQVRRVPVIDDGGSCVGMVAQADLARHEQEADDHAVRRTVERISEPRGRPRSESEAGVRSGR